MSSLAWTIAALLAVPVVYAVVSAVALLFIRVPDEPHYAPLEDLLFVVTLPFVVAVVGFVRFRRGR